MGAESNKCHPVSFNTIVLPRNITTTFTAVNPFLGDLASKIQEINKLIREIIDINNFN
jgi:hypothetical protein